jgi:CRP-like cAMP-binding protein
MLTMLLKDETELLRRVPLFAQVSPAKLKLLAFASDRVKYGAGQTLFHQGDPGDAAYVVLSGDADVLINTPSGEQKIAAVEPNAIVGEIAILCDVARTATVRAATALEALRIRKEHFVQLLSENPGMALEIMRVLADRLSRTTSELTQAKSELARRKQ